GGGGFVAADIGADRQRVAVGGVESEAGTVEVDHDLTQAERDAFEDEWEGIRDSGDLRGFGIDLDGCPDDDVAEVIATGDGRSDEDKGHRGTFVWPCEVDLPGEI